MEDGLLLRGQIMQLNNKIYDFLKWVVMIFLPALGAFYFGLSQFWDLPYVTEIVGSVSVTSIFLGALIGISSKSYGKNSAGFDGELVVNKDDPEKDVYSFVVYDGVDQLEGKDTLTIKVSPRYAEPQ